MKIHSLIFLFFFLSGNLKSQNVIISGYSFLEFQGIHDSIKVNFNRTLPSVFSDSTYTDSAGYYQKSLPSGIYDITFSKGQFIPVSFTNYILYVDSILADTTLETLGLSGSLSGTLTTGIYKVGGDIQVAQGNTLIIQPGVTLKFKELTQFDIHGLIIANGNVTDSIIFTSYNSSHWDGVKFDRFVNPISSLSFSKIERAMLGLDIDRCPITISNIRVSDNVSAIKINETNFSMSNVDVENNYVDHIYENLFSCPGLAISNGDSISLINCKIINNTNSPLNTAFITTGGIAVGGVVLKIFNSIIANNSGDVGAINFQSQTDGIEIYNSTIANNTGKYTGGLNYNGWSPLKIYNTIITNNSASSTVSSFGGIWDNRHSMSQIWNNNFWNNFPSDYYTDSLTFVKNILTVNTNNDSCDVFSNIFLDPQFVNPAHDFHLLSSSPCIDAGSNTSVFYQTDLENSTRIIDGNGDLISVVDQGVFEFGIMNGISSNNNSDNFNLFPNPIYDNFSIISERKINSIMILNNFGIIVCKVEAINNNHYTGNVSNFKKGIYTVLINFESDYLVKRVIILSEN